MIRPDIENLKNGRIIANNDDLTITAPPAAHKIFDWIEHLEAENATLKAHNRQMIEAIQSHSCILAGSLKHGCHLCNLLFDPSPIAKLAMAEAEVLRAAEAYINVDLSNSVRFLRASNALQKAVEAVKEARKDA